MAEVIDVQFGARDAGLEPEAKAAATNIGLIGAAVKELQAAFAPLGAAATASFDKVVAGAEEASTSLKEMRDVGLEVRESFRGLGEALIAAFAIDQVKDATERMAETAEQVQHTADTFGVTTDEVQRLKAEAAGLGIPFETFTMAMQREDNALTRAREGSKQTAEAFKMLGINIKEPIGQAQLLQKTLEGLKTLTDIPTREGIAQQLGLVQRGGGGGGAALGALLGATKEQLDALTESTARFGAVNAEAQGKGLLLADAFNQQKIAMQGLGNTLTAQLAPMLTTIVIDVTNLLESFREWAAQGDNLKDALTGMTVAAVALASILGAGALTAAVEGLASLLGGIFLGAIQLATAGMVEFDVAADANPIGALVLAIEGLVAGLVLLYGWLEKVGVIHDIADAAGPVWTTLADAVKLVSDAFAPLANFLNAYAVAQDKVVESAAVGWWRELVSELRQAGTYLGELNGFVQRLQQMDVASDVGAWAQKQLGLNSAVEALNVDIGEAITGVGNFLKADFPGVVSAWDGWVQTLKRDIDALTGAWNDFVTAISGKKPIAGPGIGGAFAGGGARPDLFGKEPVKAGGNNALPQPTTKSHGAGQVEIWANELREAEMRMRESTGAWLQDMKDYEAQFWASKLAQAKPGSKEYEQIRGRADAAELAAKQQTVRQLLDMDRDAVAEQKGNWAATLAAEKKWLDDTVKAYGTNKAAIEAVQKQIEANQKAHDQKMAEEAAAAAKRLGAAQAAADKQQLQIETIGFSERRALLEAEAGAGRISRTQAFQQELALLRQEESAKTAAADKEYQDTLASLQKQAAAYQQAGLTEKFKQVQQQIELLQQQHNSQMQLLAAQGAQAWLNEWIKRFQQLQQQYRSYVDPMVQSFGSNMLSMARGTETWQQALVKIGETAEDLVVSAIEKLIENWIVGLLTARTQQTITALAQVESNAAVAASGAAAATAMIPIVGPELAPGAAAAMFMDVMAWAGPASAAGGYDIPAGVNPLVQAHAKEMVLPAHIAQPLRAALAGGGGGGLGRTIHQYFSPTIHAHEPPSLGKLLDEQGSDMLGWLQGAARDGLLDF